MIELRDQWRGYDSVDHTVSFQNNGISSADLGTNDTFSHTFTTPGTHNYICTIHPFMHGTIVVAADGKTRTVTSTTTNAAGVKVTSTLFYDKS